MSLGMCFVHVDLFKIIRFVLPQLPTGDIAKTFSTQLFMISSRQIQKASDYLQPTQVPSLTRLYTMQKCAQKKNIPPDPRWLLFSTPCACTEIFGDLDQNDALSQG